VVFGGKMTNEETVTISKAEYERLQRREWKLECLEMNGVDNWEWYDEAMKEYREDVGED
jgi:hypothetical protein